MMPKSFSKLTPPTAQLLDAIEKLEAYINRPEDPSRRARLSETFAKLRSLFSGKETHHSKPEKSRYRLPSDQEMNAAIEIVNRSRLLIETLHRGTEEEKKLAESLNHTIAKYNTGCDLRIKKLLEKQPLLTRLRQNGSEAPTKIAVVPKISVSRHYPGEKESQSSLLPDAARAVSAASILVPRQSAELFHMKVLALLERYGIASNHEARTIIKNSPIRIELANDPSTCTLIQTLALFPGQTVIVKGSSSLDPKTSTIKKLFPETFSLTLESTQTGFPDPSQRCGWTVAGQLIPFSPQRIDLLLKTAPLFHKKLSAIAGLQPQGDLLKRAKSLIAARKQTFNKNSQVLLPLHKKLIESMITEGNERKDASLQLQNISKFFDTLSADTKPFDLLCEVNRLVIDFYIVEPRKRLIEGIIKGKETPLGSEDASERFIAVERLFDDLLIDNKKTVKEWLENDHMLPSEAHDYIVSVGDILSRAAKDIILQYLSEDLIYSPQKLTRFQSAVQTTAYRQLEGFLDELFDEEEKHTSEHSFTLLEKMKSEILEDIAIITCTKEHALADELADYFEKRHASLS